jgi:hypothetical protein
MDERLSEVAWVMATDRVPLWQTAFAEAYQAEIDRALSLEGMSVVGHAQLSLRYIKATSASSHMMASGLAGLGPMLATADIETVARWLARREAHRTPPKSRLRR